jgi:hypothetical protein
MPFSIVVSIAISLVVLLLFLFLRKAMARGDVPA